MSISQRKLSVRQDIHVSKTRVCEAKPKQWHKRIRFWCQDIKHLEHGSNDFICFCSSYLTELDDGTIFRKPLRVRVKPWFPVGFPLNQSIDYHYTSTRDIAYRPTVLPSYPIVAVEASCVDAGERTETQGATGIVEHHVGCSTAESTDVQ